MVSGTVTSRIIFTCSIGPSRNFCFSRARRTEARERTLSVSSKASAIVNFPARRLGSFRLAGMGRLGAPLPLFSLLTSSVSIATSSKTWALSLATPASAAALPLSSRTRFSSSSALRRAWA